MAQAAGMPGSTGQVTGRSTGGGITPPRGRRTARQTATAARPAGCQQPSPPSSRTPLMARGESRSGLHVGPRRGAGRFAMRLVVGSCRCRLRRAGEAGLCTGPPRSLRSLGGPLTRDAAPARITTSPRRPPAGGLERAATWSRRVSELVPHVPMVKIRNAGDPADGSRCRATRPRPITSTTARRDGLRPRQARSRSGPVEVLILKRAGSPRHDGISSATRRRSISRSLHG